MLPTRRIVPLGTCHTVPFTDRSRVARSDTDSTVPVTGVPAQLADVDDVADAVLVLDDDEDPGEEVLHEALGAEAEGDAGDPGAGDERARG